MYILKPVQKDYWGKIHLGFDGWTSPNVISFLGVVIHITYRSAALLVYFGLHKVSLPLNTFQFDPIDDVLASRKVTLVITLWKSSTNVFKNSGYTPRYRCFSHDCSVSSQILGQACNNVFNNDMMLSALEALNPKSMSGIHTCIWCICHILNLVIKVSS